MARAPAGGIVRPVRKTGKAKRLLHNLADRAESSGELAVWRRARAVLGYIDGQSAIALSRTLGVDRSIITRWLEAYDAQGLEALQPEPRPGAKQRLTTTQQEELLNLIETGPETAGYTSGVWTGPMIGDLIQKRFGVRYHPHYVPELLHHLGLSVQRPRKRLARADLKAQEYWVKVEFPAIKKKAKACRGIVLFEDEASFWLDGTLHHTWSPVGEQPRVPTFGLRKTAHVYGAIALKDGSFSFRFAPVFNGRTFHEFLIQLVAEFGPRKIFLIIDNGPCHWLDDDGKQWLRDNPGKVELCRLPPYSPEFNATEGVWKVTRKMTTHNRFFHTVEERDAALTATFRKFQAEPHRVEPQVARFR